MSKSTQLGPGVWLVRHNNGRYYLRFRDTSRTPIEKWPALETKKKDTATVRANAKYRDYLLGVYDPWENVAFNISIDEAIKRYERSKSSKAGDVHISDVVKLVRRLKEEAGVIELAAISPEHVDKFVFGRDIKNKTRDSYRRRYNAFFNWCRQAGLIKHNPVQKVDRPRVPILMPKHYTLGEFDRLLVAIDDLDEERSKYVHTKDANPKWLPQALEFLFFAGTRISEACRVTWGDVKFDQQRIHISQETKETKSKEDRVVPLLPRLEKLLLHLQESTRSTSSRGELVLKNRYNTAGISANHTNRRFNQYRKHAGLPPIGLHGFRHSYAFYLIQQGVGIEHVKEFLGHSSLDVTQIYAKMSPDERLEIVMRTLGK